MQRYIILVYLFQMWYVGHDWYSYKQTEKDRQNEVNYRGCSADNSQAFPRGQRIPKKASLKSCIKCNYTFIWCQPNIFPNLSISLKCLIILSKKLVGLFKTSIITKTTGLWIFINKFLNIQVIVSTLFV